MQATVYDLSGMAGSNIRLSVIGKDASGRSIRKAVNGKEFIGSLSHPKISEESQQVGDRKAALKRARFQVFEAAMLGEDRLYRRTE